MKDTEIDLPKGFSGKLTFKITIVPPLGEAMKLGFGYTWGAIVAISQAILLITIIEWVVKWIRS